MERLFEFANTLRKDIWEQIGSDEAKAEIIHSIKWIKEEWKTFGDELIVDLRSLMRDEHGQEVTVYAPDHPEGNVPCRYLEEDIFEQLMIGVLKHLKLDATVIQLCNRATREPLDLKMNVTAYLKGGGGEVMILPTPTAKWQLPPHYITVTDVNHPSEAKYENNWQDTVKDFIKKYSNKYMSPLPLPGVPYKRPQSPILAVFDGTTQLDETLNFHDYLTLHPNAIIRIQLTG